MTSYLKTLGEWKIPLSIAINFSSSMDTDKMKFKV